MNLNTYTKRAFKILPDIDSPMILDIGCGTGVPTMELLRLTNGTMVAIDIDRTSLDLLRIKATDTGCMQRVRVIEGSITDMDNLNDTFDIVWSEGSVFVMGFEKSIRVWRRFIKPDGFLVVHDEDRDRNSKLEAITLAGYRTIGQFELSEDVWWNAYYIPQEELIHEFQGKYPYNVTLDEEMNKDLVEIDKCRSRKVVFSSFFVVMQKDD